MPKVMGDIYYLNHHSTGVSFAFVCMCVYIFTHTYLHTYIVCVCVQVYVHTYVCASVCAGTCVCMWSEVSARCLPERSLLLEAGSLTEPTAHRFGLI